MNPIKPLALAATLLAGSALADDTAPAPKRILDVELRMLNKISSKVPKVNAKKSDLTKVLTDFDGRRKTQLKALTDDLKALEKAQGGAVEPLLDKLETHRKTLRELRTAKQEELGSHFTDAEKLKFLVKMGERHAKRGHKGKRIAGFFRRHASSFMTKILGIKRPTVDALMVHVEAQKQNRQAMKTEFKQFVAEVKAQAATGSTDEETARLLIAKGRNLRKKAHDSQDAALAAARQALTAEQRAEIVTKAYAGIRTIAGWVGAFWEIDELKLLQ